jgi:hypothetical protein
MRTLQKNELDLVGGGDVWVLEDSDGKLWNDGRTIAFYGGANDNEFYRQACSLFGNVVEGAAGLFPQTSGVAYPLGLAGEGWCNSGFQNSSGSTGEGWSGGGGSGFGGGGAGGTWSRDEDDMLLLIE